MQVKRWPRLPSEEVGAPSLGTFQVWLDGAQDNLIWLKMSLILAGGLDQMTLKCPFQPKPFYNFKKAHELLGRKVFLLVP